MQVINFTFHDSDHYVFVRYTIEILHLQPYFNIKLFKTSHFTITLVIFFYVTLFKFHGTLHYANFVVTAMFNPSYFPDFAVKALFIPSKFLFHCNDFLQQTIQNSHVVSITFINLILASVILSMSHYSKMRIDFQRWYRCYDIWHDRWHGNWSYLCRLIVTSRHLYTYICIQQ